MAKDICFIFHSDHDLVKAVKLTNRLNYKIGQDVGLVSFNDSPLKEIAGNGITTISTDFEQMGRHMTRMILEGTSTAIHNESKVYLRNSL